MDLNMSGQSTCLRNQFRVVDQMGTWTHGGDRGVPTTTSSSWTRPLAERFMPFSNRDPHHGTTEDLLSSVCGKAAGCFGRVCFQTD